MKEIQNERLPRVILADNSSVHLQMLKGYAELMCGQLQICGSYLSGAQLLSELENGLTADLLIADFFFSDMDICVFYTQLRQHPGRDLPRILCTIEQQDSWQREKLLSLGLDCYMIKPYHMDKLFQQAQTLCGLGPAEEESEQTIHRLLASLGFTEKRMVPYLYTVYAVQCILASWQRRPLAKQIYDQVATQELVTVSAVESALRRAARQAYENHTEEYMELCARAGKTTERPLGNGAYLEMLAHEVYSLTKTR